MMIHVAVYPAPDVPGAWIGHVLDNDIVTQADTKEGARAAALEAWQLVREWDETEHVLTGELEERKPAPPEAWDRPHESIEVTP